MKRKYFVFLLVAVMIFSLVLSGCQGNNSGVTTATDATTKDNTGGAETLKPVELVWYTAVDQVRADTKMVWDEINNYLKETINVTLDYHFFEVNEYNDKITPVMSSGQYVDIVFTGSSFNFVGNAQNEAFYDIKDLIPQYLPKTQKIIPQGAWDAVTLDGHIYGIPTYKDIADRFCLLYNKTMTDKYNLDPLESGEWSTVIDTIPFLYEAKAARDAEQPELADQPIIRMLNGLKRFYPLEGLVSVAAVNVPGIDAFKGKGSGETVFNIYETDEYREMCKLINKLVEDRIFPYDHSNFDPDRAFENSGKLIGTYSGGYIEIKPDIYAGRETVLSTSAQTIMTTQNIQSSIQAVSVQSKNPERSLMFLELLNSDKTLGNLVRFGIQGEHYLYNDEGRLDITISPRNKGISSYADYPYYYWYGWTLGNILAGDLPSVVSKDFGNLLNEMNNSAIQDTNIGFIVDTVPIANEIAACSNIIAEYDSSTNLRSGMAKDIDKTLDEFIAKLKANGSQKIVDEVQKQLTAWRASVGKPVKK